MGSIREIVDFSCSQNSSDELCVIIYKDGELGFFVKNGNKECELVLSKKDKKRLIKKLKK